MAMTDSSIVEYAAEHEGYRCGYCHSPNTNFSHGMWAHQLNVEDYQALIDRGWRRSGKYTYKPTMKLTCCPQYPIRCDVTDLRLSKSQKKAIKRVNHFLSYGHRPDHRSSMDHGEDRGHGQEEFAVDQRNRLLSDTSKEDVRVCTSRSASLDPDLSSVAAHSSDSTAVQLISFTNSAVANPDLKDKSHHHPKPGLGQDPTKPLPKKAKLLRFERKQAKLLKATAASGESAPLSEQGKKKDKQKQKTLEDYLNDVIESPAHKLELQLVCSNPRSKEFDQKFSACYQIYHKYQTTIHRDPPDKPNERQYTRFLIDSPLFQPEHLAHSSLPQGYGSFHQHYILDGKIIAVGVIDILPHCVSSVYFYYDPDYSFLSLGTYSALRELAFTQFLHKLQPEISYYYLGFYIHSCPKMRYKGQYVPSYLCCPETYKWFPLEECQRKLDVCKYSRFAQVDIVDENQLTNIDEVMCLYQRTAIPYGIYRRGMKLKSKGSGDQDEVKQYANFVGSTCARRMLLLCK